MASSYTTNKGLEKPGNGDYVDTWNVPVNGDMDVIDQAFGGVTSLNATSGSAVLTDTQYRSLIINVSGAISANVTYTIPSGVGGQWIIRNTTTDSTGGPWTVTFVSGGGGSAYIIPRGSAVTVFSDGTGVRASADSFSSGTAMLFAQTSAPTGWTKSTAHDNKALRVVTGAASTGGSVGFTSAFSAQALSGTVGGTALTTNQIPSHTHFLVAGVPGTRVDLSATNQIRYYTAASEGGIPNENFEYELNGTTQAANIGLSSATGGGQTHTHTFAGTIDLNVAYVDVIIATKD